MTTQTFHWYEDPDEICQGGAVTIGNFDGVHLGHQSLLAEVRRQAARVNGPAVVITFDPHPMQLLRPDRFPPLLTTIETRAQLLQDYGADIVLILQTTPDLLQLRAREFFDDVLLAKLHPKVLVPGFNFGFGRNREGNVDTLAEYCIRSGVAYVLVSPTEERGKSVSSSRIREAIQSGDVQLAGDLLGRPYSVMGTVIEGQKRGNTIGFPTANLHDIPTLIPMDGVYAGQVNTGGQLRPAAVNIGPNPTFGEDEKKVEVHIVDFSGDLYGHPLRVEFLERLRDTKSFDGVDALVAQLQKDVAETRRIANEK